MKERVLLIEDDQLIFTMLGEELGQLGYSLEQVLDGKSGLDLALAEEFALVIIDGNLPRLDGFEVCRRLKEKKQRQPVIMLTFRSDEVDRVLGIEFGADDYVTKPFSLRELSARIKSLLRRVNELQSKRESETSIDKLNKLDFGVLQIDTEKHEVIAHKKTIDLTAIEYRLLIYFAKNRGKVLSSEDLRCQVWNHDTAKFESTITATIARLRAKIELHPARPTIIVTVRGHGYRFL